MVTRWSRALSILVVVATIAASLLPVALVRAQQGATMTVLRGQVAIIRPDGSAVQPAPSGTVVNAGDEIRTLSRTGALITFFTGTEIELGEETILVVEQVSRQGDRIDVSLRQVLGATVNRVQTVTGSGSTYRVDAGGAVALVRGTTFAVIGPVTTGAGNLVVIVCLEDCAPTSTFAGCPLAPFMGYGVSVERGEVTSECVSFAVDRAAGLFNAGFEGITTVEQNLQGDTRGVPAGQVAAGQRQEASSRIDRDRRAEDEREVSNQPVVPIAPPLVGAPIPVGSPVPTGTIPTGTACPTPTGGGGTVAVRDLTTGLTAQDLANLLVGSGVTVSNVRYTGAPVAAGTFTGGATSVGFDSGIILSTGGVTNVPGPNSSDSISRTNGTPGDPALAALAGGATSDAAILEFDFTTTASTVSLQYVFGSDEYNEFANRSFNDVFAFFLNGTNIAVVPGTGQPVAINTINGGNPLGVNPQNPQFYRNNDPSDAPPSINIEMDGLTVILVVQATVQPGVTNRIRLAISDVGDSRFDSNVFLRAGSFVGGPPIACP